MKHGFPILIIFVLTFSVQAQSWCPPNAEWHYSRLDQQGPSYAKVTYAGTVMINTVQCQQLNYFAEVYNTGNNITSNYTLSPYYTYFSNNLVFLNKKYSNSFDTLYNFNAVPGSQWLLPASYTYTFLSTCSKSKLTVLDTGHQIIQSVNLKWFKVQISPGNLNDTIFERIGFLKFYFMNYDLCTGTQDYNEGGPLRCYSDNQIVNYKKVNYACNFLVTPNLIRENSILSNINFFPNPVQGKLTIIWESNKSEIYTINITDCFGQNVYSLNKPFSKQEIDVSFLSTGLYYLKVRNASEQKVFKIVKE